MWKVKECEYCFTCAMKYEDNICKIKSLTDDAIFVGLIDKKYYAMVSDGGECYSMCEVEKEVRCEG